MTRWLLLVACGLAGCGDKKPGAKVPPTETTHYLTFERLRDEDGRQEWYPDVALDGAIVLVDGIEQGAIDASGLVGVSVGAGRSFEDRSVTLSLRLPTPCGVRDVPLPYVSASALASDGVRNEVRGRPKVTVRRDPSAPPLPAATNIYVDDERAPSAAVRFGAVELQGGPRYQNGRPAKGRFRRLWEPGCAPEHVVTIDGAKVGVARSADPDAIGFLISTDPQACYQREVTIYSDDPNQTTGSPRTFPVLRGQVNATGWDGISYFLEDAPHGIDRGAGAGGIATRRSLTRAPCEPAPSSGGT